ncbi:hypothetical protein RBH26_03360 [Natronolimnohabitans sp. A-GB9]|uniref:hypothetical protein n=1 Tax=Natronolimnohabitans sp. A-GB9 TaxID=3069757 RepID=UPI0027B8298E|nr:hypothetical protein [Natronolimnohabitans sp. A-GB9]MDQ2049514.1 hypothetical protein [Natronolimnohabitans sp. A-GB9]
MSYLEYYDKLLLAIIGSLMLGIAVGVATSIAFTTGIAVGAALATVFVYEAMFRNPPLPPSASGRAVAAVGWHAFLAVVLVAAAV